MIKEAETKKMQRSHDFRNKFNLERKKSFQESEIGDQLSEISECARYDDYQLKNVRNLKKYDTWDDDLDPDTWVKRCHEEIGVGKAHCQVPVYKDKK